HLANQDDCCELTQNTQPCPPGALLRACGPPELLRPPYLVQSCNVPPRSLPTRIRPMAEPEFDVRSFLAGLPAKPGVYRMLAADGKILYVGKARHLRHRVGSYFHGRPQDSKTLAMLEQMARIEVTVTASETEALLLEANLVKRHRPRYNVMLRDDKSFPYIHVATNHEFPRMSFYRGSRKLPGRYFGPYPSAVATRETLVLLQKLF